MMMIFLLSVALTALLFSENQAFTPISIHSRPSTELNLALPSFRIFRRSFSKQKQKEAAIVVEDGKPVGVVKLDKTPAINTTTNTDEAEKPKAEPKPAPVAPKKDDEQADLIIIGGGVAGLTAAITAATAKKGAKIVVLEAQDTLGGRVQTDKTDDGFLLDRGFAVFIEEYPASKDILDYDDLQLGRFQPGALVKLKNRFRLAKVADPLRQPEDIFASIFEPVGNIIDKIKLLPLIAHAKSNSVEQLFNEQETDTETALTERWGLGQGIIDPFFRPFLEGIYLAPLNLQSSRLFHFIFKMFSDGAACLPTGGIGAVATQLASKATKAGVVLKTGTPVKKITVNEKDNTYTIETAESIKMNAKSVIVATDGEIAQRFIAQIPGFESLSQLPHQPQRKVGCLYYAFKGPAPVTEPILILNGIGKDRGTPKFPVNNCCFPSVVNKAYAPEGYNLCSATILGDAAEYYEDREEELDQAVRQQLASWFVDYSYDIMNKWELKAIYDIANAQPAQYKGPMPANEYGGRPCNVYRGKPLPKGLYVAGDHVATSTLNGALISGVNAGTEASKGIKLAPKAGSAKAVGPKGVKGAKATVASKASKDKPVVSKGASKTEAAKEPATIKATSAPEEASVEKPSETTEKAEETEKVEVAAQ